MIVFDDLFVCILISAIFNEPLLDIDECQPSNADCHSNATCSNTVGSYFCSCIGGFSGDGKINCASRFSLIFHPFSC